MDPDIKLQIQVDVMGLNEVRQLQKEMSNLIGVGNKIKKTNEDQLGVWDRLRQRLDDIENRYDAVFRAGFRLQNLGHDLNRMGQAGIGVLQKSVEKWGDFEFSLNRAAGALEIFDTTLPIYDALKQGIYKVAQEARIFPAEDIAKAVYYWGSTTGQVVETHGDLRILLEGLIPIMKAAAITETDYESAIKGTYSILVQYGLGLESARDVTEKLMLITQKTAAEYPDLINSFKMTGPIAASLGISFDEVVKYVGMIADAGIRGTMSGRALRQTFIKLVDPTNRAKKALDEVFTSNVSLGKSFDELIFPEGEFIGFTGYVDILATAMENLTQQEKNQLLGIITTQNELPVLTALVNKQIEARQGNANAIDQEKLSLANAHEQFEATFALLSGSWQGIVGYFQNSVIPIVHLVGVEVARMLGPALEFFAEIAQAVHQFLVQHPVITEWIVKLTALTSVLLLVAGAIFTVGGTLFILGAGIGTAIESTIAVVAELGGFLSRMSAVGAVVILIAALLITNFGGIRDAVISLGGVFGEFVEFLGEIFEQAARTFEFFLGVVVGVISVIDEFFKALGQIKDGTPARQVTILGNVFSFLAGAIEGVLGTMIGLTAVVMAGKVAMMAYTAVTTGFAVILAVVKSRTMAVVAAHVAETVALGARTVATGLATVAQWGLVKASLAFIATPIGAAITGVVVGVVALVAAFKVGGEAINNFAMDFGHMGDELNRVADETGHSYQKIKDEVKALMEEQGLTFDQAIERVEKYGFVSEEMSEAVRFAGKTAGESTDGHAALAAQLGVTEEELGALGLSSEQAGSMLDSLGERATSLTEQLEEAKWADTVVGQLQIAAQEGRLEAANIPLEIAAGILEGRNDVVQAAKGLADAATYELMNEARIGEIRVKMDEATQSIEDAIVEGTPGAVAAAEAEYAALELELAGYLLTVDANSKEAAAILEKYIKSSDPATQAAAQAMYMALEDKAFIAKHNIEQYAVDMGMAPEQAIKLFKGGAILQAELLALGVEAPVEDLVAQLQTHGEDATKGLAAAVEENAFLAGTATGEVKKKAEANLILLKELASDYGFDITGNLADGIQRAAGKVRAEAEYVSSRARVGFDRSYNYWWSGGNSVGVAWANGLRSSADWARQVAWEVAASADAALHGLSPPKEGPLHTIDKGGFNVGWAWIKGLRKVIPMARTEAHALAGVVSDTLSMGSGGLAVGATFESNQTRTLKLEVDVSSSDGTVSNDNAQKIADAIQKGLMLDRLEHLVSVS